MIRATLEYPPYADGARKKEESIHITWAAAYQWADQRLPMVGPDREFVHTLDDVIEHAQACVRESQLPLVQTFTQIDPPRGYHPYILTLEVK